MNCKECNRTIELNYLEPTKQNLTTRQLCFSCNFWFEILEHKDKPYSAVIDNQHFTLGPDNTIDKRLKGHGGRKFIIKFDDGREVTTNDLWHQGEIPEHYRDRLPNNAVFLPTT